MSALPSIARAVLFGVAMLGAGGGARVLGADRAVTGVVVQFNDGTQQRLAAAAPAPTPAPAPSPAPAPQTPPPDARAA